MRNHSGSSGFASSTYFRKYLFKGRQVYVEGRLQTREFEGKNASGKRQRAEIVAQRVQFLGPRPDAPIGGEAEELAASEEIPF
jgi:single-stranded DNA-binding protein